MTTHESPSKRQSQVDDETTRVATVDEDAAAALIARYAAASRTGIVRAAGVGIGYMIRGRS